MAGALALAQIEPVSFFYSLAVAFPSLALTLIIILLILVKKII